MSDVKKNYTKEELDRMSNAELAALGTELDDVTVAYRKERYPVEGDPREVRCHRHRYLADHLDHLGVGLPRRLPVLAVGAEVPRR